MDKILNPSLKKIKGPGPKIKLSKKKITATEVQRSRPAKQCEGRKRMYKAPES